MFHYKKKSFQEYFLFLSLDIPLFSLSQKLYCLKIDGISYEIHSIKMYTLSGNMKE